jgi:ATP-dependent DNA helicase RecQ
LAVLAVRMLEGMDTRRILRERFGFDDFRPAQREVIDLVLSGQNVLSVMPTGSGKSLCFQLPALLLPGLTLVVSPLIALMKDQTDHLDKLGVPAGVINSTVRRDIQRDRLDQAASGEIKLLYVAPERFQNQEFMAAIRKLKVSLFAVDEAHCVSLWGHDFRPDYLRLRRAIDTVGKPPVVALTATATPVVRTDILKQLGIEGAAQIVSGFDRPNLYLEVREVASVGEKVQAIVELCAWGRTGIIYSGTRGNVENIHRALRRHNIDAVAYHAGLSINDRKAVQDRFMSRETGIIVATNAFGMGIDRPDVRFVVHADVPDSLEAYYQEVGRAGRDGDPAHGLLLFNYADKWIPEVFIDASHPPADFLRQVYGRLLAAGEPVVIGDKWRQVAARMDQKFHSAVTILHRAGYVERMHTAAGSGLRILRPNDSQLRDFNFEDLERRREFELRKLRVMLEYASRFKKHCYRSFVLRYFGEWTKVKDCGNCSRCAPVTRERFRAALPLAAAVTEELPAPRKSEAPAGDATIVALKILSCILRASEQIGREKVARILAGSNDASVQSFKHLTTYGILPEYSIRSIVGIIDFLIGEGYIDPGEGFRPTIRVTTKGRQFLKERPSIAIPTM